jgi:hypothetical protein
MKLDLKMPAIDAEVLERVARLVAAEVRQRITEALPPRAIALDPRDQLPSLEPSLQPILTPARRSGEGAFFDPAPRERPRIKMSIGTILLPVRGARSKRLAVPFLELAVIEDPNRFGGKR